MAQGTLVPVAQRRKPRTKRHDKGRIAQCRTNLLLETEEDVLRDAAQHGMKEHGKKDKDMIQMQDNLRASIRNS